VREIARQYWVGEVVLAAFFGAVVLAAALLSPSSEAVSLFGVEVPALCAFRNLTGTGCPGCGLTRSFSFMAHGDPVQAFRMNWIGPFLFLAFASQPPYRLYRAANDLFQRRALARARSIS
jgi:hypothetical protein